MFILYSPESYDNVNKHLTKWISWDKYKVDTPCDIDVIIKMLKQRVIDLSTRVLGHKFKFIFYSV